MNESELKQRVAKEWLIAAGSVIPGTGFTMFLYIIHQGSEESFWQDWPGFVLIIVGPWLVVQLIRSLFWAAKVMDQKWATAKAMRKH